MRYFCSAAAGWGLSNRVPLIGSWIARQLLRHVLKANSTGDRGSCSLVAKALALSPYSSVKLEALEILGGIHSNIRNDVGATAAIVQSCTDDDPTISRAAMTVVKSTFDEFEKDTLCDLWVEARDPRLEQLIQTENRVGGTSRVAKTTTALLNDDSEYRANLNATDVEDLINILESESGILSDAAGLWLFELKSGACRDRLLSAIREGTGRRTRQIAASTGFSPQEPADRAIFLYLTQQWQRLRHSDRARRFLRLGCFRASPEQRKELIHSMHQSNRLEDLELLAGDHWHRNPSHFGDSESIFSAEFLAEKREWKALWSHISSFPLDIALKSLLRLADSGWQPSDGSDRRIFQDAVGIAQSFSPGSPGLSDIHLPPFALRRVLPVAGRVHDLSFSPDDRSIAVATSEGVRTVDLVNGSAALNFKPAGCPVGKIAWLDEETLVFGEHSRDPRYQCRLFLGTTGSDKTQQFAVTEGRLTSLSTIDSQSFVTTGRDGRISFWKRAKGARTRSFWLQNRRWPRSAVVSPDRRSIAVLADGVAVASLHDMRHSSSMFGRRVIRCAAFLPDGNLLTGAESGSVRKWFVHRNRFLVRIPDFGRHNTRVSAVAVIEHHGIAVSAGTGGTIQAYHLDSGESAGSTKLAGKRIESLTVSRNGERMAAGHPEGFVSLWDFGPRSLPFALDQPMNTFHPGLYESVQNLLTHGEIEPPAEKYLRLIEVLFRNRVRTDVTIERLVLSVQDRTAVNRRRT